MQLIKGPKLLNDTNVVVPEFPYVFDMEREFDVDSGLNWIDRTFHLVVIVVIAYLVLIYCGQRYMRDRPRYDLTLPLFLWNIGLALFSFAGVSRGLFELYFVLTRFGFKHTVCEMALKEHYNPMGFWGVLFVFSKLVELGDTAFIIMRKQPLLFLHWYHHITVLLVAWYTAPEVNTTVRWFATLNALVHFFMYTHFALRTVKVPIPRYITMMLTAVQTGQMVIGLVINIVAYYFLRNGEYCHVTVRSIQLSFFIAFTYLILFSHYFYDAYITDTPMLKSIELRRKKDT